MPFLAKSGTRAVSNMTSRALVLLILNFTLVLCQSSGKQCLTGFKASFVSAQEVHLEWDYTCNELDGQTVKKVRFKTYYKHKEWLACGDGRPDRQRGTGKGTHEGFDLKSARIGGLNPYSTYEFTVKALPMLASGNRASGSPEELEIQVNTKEDIPGVRPIVSSVSTASDSSSLRFYWRAPKQSECQHFRSNLNGFVYELRGQDRWNAEESIQGHTLETSHRFAGLKPMSRYKLFVYSANSAGLYNPESALIIEKATKESPIPLHPPRDLLARRDQDGFRVSWLPPYPPTTKISQYDLRWKQSGSKEWLGKFSALPGTDQCLDVQDEELTCLIVDDLRVDNDPDQPLLENVTFQVSYFLLLLFCFYFL